VNPAVDQFGKVTVSLGGRCPVGCRHCYVNARSFSPDPKRSVSETVEVLRRLSRPFTVVCLSGDVDCFLRPQRAIELLDAVAREFPKVDVIFTTRLVPPHRVLEQLHDLGTSLADEGRLLLGCVSFVSSRFPNTVEEPQRVATTQDRVALLRALSRGRQPAVAALRPTFPFNVVPRREVSDLIAQCAPWAAVLLGEAFILDQAGEIAAKIGMRPALGTDEISHLTFLHQTSTWRKRLLTDETSFASLVARGHGRPYFMRSISAVKFLKSYWDLSAGESRYQVGDYLDTAAELVRP
jgi:hypothetical protein